MLHWCGNGSSGSTTAPCSFSILFPVSGKQVMEEGVDGGTVSSSVDCTLTLGTPYTRYLSSSSSSSSSAMQSSSSSTSLCWDITPQPGKHSSSANAGGSFTGSVSGRGGTYLNGDPFLLARRCANCDTTSTPLWRNGPRGPKSLCNACGIRYKKEERRAAASSAATVVPVVSEAIGYGYTRGQPQHPWSCYTPATAAVNISSVSVYNGEAEEQRELYLPWRLNVVPQQFQAVAERGGLSQYQ
ncbi:GATA transcription factor 18-like [Phalaenopsis equestris]|uniref:GATA transcription factor 18-like n=1 Tax=Phalaenopsis equestris TaxID=78828 RepID=UPI0009E5EF55|nr:GATA transcription factor 18-like [Phalaenopsis equestris]